MTWSENRGPIRERQKRRRRKILFKEKQVWQFLMQLSVPCLGCGYTPSMPLGILPLLNEPQPGGTPACRPATTPAMIHRAINLTREICLVLVPLAPPILTWDVVINVSLHWWSWDRLTDGEGATDFQVELGWKEQRFQYCSRISYRRIKLFLLFLLHFLRDYAKVVMSLLNYLIQLSSV